MWALLSDNSEVKTTNKLRKSMYERMFFSVNEKRYIFYWKSITMTYTVNVLHMDSTNGQTNFLRHCRELATFKHRNAVIQFTSSSTSSIVVETNLNG